MGDLIDSNDNKLTIEEISKRHNAGTDFLTYLRMKKALTNYLSKYNIPQINNVSYTRPTKIFIKYKLI